MPSWRADIHGKADIVEEVVRIIGVGRVPATPFERGEAPRKPVLTSFQVRRGKAARALAVRGMLEAVTWSFIARDQAQLFGGGSPELALRNPIASDLSDMRPSLLPGLTKPHRKMPIADSRMSLCSKWDRFSGATGRKTSLPLLPASAHGLQKEAAATAIGPGQRSKRMHSMPKPTRWLFSQPPERPCRRCRSLQEPPPGFILAAAAQFK